MGSAKINSVCGLTFLKNFVNPVNVPAEPTPTTTASTLAANAAVEGAKKAGQDAVDNTKKAAEDAANAAKEDAKKKANDAIDDGANKLKKGLGL